MGQVELGWCRRWAGVGTAVVLLVTVAVVGVGAPRAVAAPDDCPAQTLTIPNASVSPPVPGFTVPTAVAVDGAGNVYVADFTTDTVYGFDATGAQFLTIDNGSASPPVPAFVNPSAVAVDGAGNVYVVDQTSDTVYGFDAAGAQFLTINSSSVPAPVPAFATPFAVGLDGVGNIYVVDQTSDTVYGFDATGTQFLTINNGSASPPVPGFSLPAGVAVDGAGNVYVVDQASDTVYGFDAAGAQFLTINNGSVPPPVPGFVNPSGVAVDGAGNVYVGDPGVGNDTVYGFDATGTQFLTINNSSASPPVPGFVNPFGVAVDGAGNVYVVDQSSDTVYRFLVNQVDLVLTSGVAPATVGVGETTTFTASVANEGPCDAAEVAIDAPLPAGLELVIADAPPGTSYDEATGMWSIGALANDGAPLALTLTARAAALGEHTLIATASTASANIGDTTTEATVTVSGSPPPPPPESVVLVPRFTG